MNSADWIHLLTAIIPSLVTAVAVVVSTRDSVRVLSEQVREQRLIMDKLSERHERSEKETSEKIHTMSTEISLLKYAIGMSDKGLDSAS